MKIVSLSEIDLSVSPNVRAELRQDVIEDYSEAYREKRKLPPLRLFFDGIYRVADGRHRYRAALQAGLKHLLCEVESGGFEECLLAALTANDRHGIRRSPADKRQCVNVAIAKWPGYSNRRLAEVCGVDDKTVAEVRRELEAEQRVEAKPVRVGRDRKPRKSRSKSRPEPAEESSPVRTVPRGVTAQVNELYREMDKLMSESAFTANATFRHCFTIVKTLHAEVQPTLPGLVVEDQPGPKKRSTLDGVREFCLAMKLTEEDADWFFYKMEGCGWKNNGKEVKDWKGTVRAWHIIKLFPSQKAYEATQSNGKPNIRNLGLATTAAAEGDRIRAALAKRQSAGTH